MAVRSGAGIFDVSHMGDIRLAGPQALAAVQHISMNDASRLALGQAQYSALLYPQGTFVDDVIVHRLDEDEYLLVINAGMVALVAWIVPGMHIAGFAAAFWTSILVSLVSFVGSVVLFIPEL